MKTLGKIYQERHKCPLSLLYFQSGKVREFVGIIWGPKNDPWYHIMFIRMVDNVFILFLHMQISPSIKEEFLFFLILKISLFKGFWFYPGGCAERGKTWLVRLQEMKSVPGSCEEAMF